METKTIIIISVSSVIGVFIIIGLIVYFASKKTTPKTKPTCGDINCQSNQKCIEDKCVDYCAGNSPGCSLSTCVCPANKSICSNDTCSSTCGSEDTCGSSSSCECGENQDCDPTTNKCVMKTCGNSQICAIGQTQICDCVGSSICNTLTGQCVQNDSLNTLFKSKVTGNIKQVQNKFILMLKKQSYFLAKVGLSYIPLSTLIFRNGDPIDGTIHAHEPGTFGNMTYQRAPSTLISTVSSTEVLPVGAETISLTQMKIIKGQRFIIDSLFPGGNIYGQNVPFTFSFLRHSGSLDTDFYNKKLPYDPRSYFEIELDIPAPQDLVQYTALNNSGDYVDNFVYTGDQLDALRGNYDMLLKFFTNADTSDFKYYGDGSGKLTTDKTKAFRLKLTPETQWFFQ